MIFAHLPSPRALLRRLREIMAQAVPAGIADDGTQGKLDAIAEAIAGSLMADVCSIYLRRGDGAMELYATLGLRQEAVHRISLAPGEGLVGMIAENRAPLNLPDADTHPRFAHKPETGEERYSSFAGVPVLRGGEAIGVLTMQHAESRTATAEEVEALETIATVLAEMLGGLAARHTAIAEAKRRNRSGAFSGVPLSPGAALGHVVLHEPRVQVAQLFADEPVIERARLADALDSLREDIDRKLTAGDFATPGEHRDVMDAYRMFAESPDWRARLNSAINDGLTAEGAVEKVHNQLRLALDGEGRAFWRERLVDLEDLANRVLRILAGRAPSALGEHMPDDAIIVARNMGPADLLDYHNHLRVIRGLVLEESSPGSHVAIVARALGIPALCQMPGILDAAESGHGIIVDGDAGTVHLQPSMPTLRAFHDKMHLVARRQAQYSALRDAPATTTDGVTVGMQMNAGLLIDLPNLNLTGADGIGLFRTELGFMITSRFPRVGEQAAIYRQVLEAAENKPVVFRALDVGGDKILPYAPRSDEENPALGWRAIRMSLDKPGLFRMQMRALIRAAAGRALHVMIPFVASVDEFRAARQLLDIELEWGRRHGRAGPKSVDVGVMIEVPSIVWQLDELLPIVDFASVGSNDLMQFTFAADRGNPRTASRFDTLHPAALRVLQHIARAAQRHGTPLTVCGEMAGSPIEALALIGVGFRSLSMSPGSIGPVKSAILGINAASLSADLEEWLATGTVDIRAELGRTARAHNIPL